MTIDERLEALTQTVELIAGMQQVNEREINTLTQNMAKFLVILESHERRISGLEDTGE